MDFYGSHNASFLWVSFILLYIAQIHLKNLAKTTWETETNSLILFFFFFLIYQKNQCSLNGGLYNVMYIQCHSQKHNCYEFFSISGVGEHAYNFEPPLIKISYQLRWENQVR
jgi:hypothetical protein